MYSALLCLQSVFSNHCHSFWVLNVYWTLVLLEKIEGFIGLCSYGDPQAEGRQTGVHSSEGDSGHRKNGWTADAWCTWQRGRDILGEQGLHCVIRPRRTESEGGEIEAQENLEETWGRESVETKERDQWGTIKMWALTQFPVQWLLSLSDSMVLNLLLLLKGEIWNSHCSVEELRRVRNCKWQEILLWGRIKNVSCTYTNSAWWM